MDTKINWYSIILSMGISYEVFQMWNNKSTMWFWIIPLGFLTFYFSLKIVHYSSGLLLKTKLSGSFVGIVLISIITSIPELISQVVQSVDGKPAVAISNDLGSNAITTLVMAVSSLFLFRSLFLKNINKESIILTIITLVTTIGFTIVLFFGKDLRIGKTNSFLIGIVPLVLLLIYIAMTIYTYYIEKGTENNPPYKYHNDSHSVTTISLFFLLFSFLLIATSVMLNLAIDATSAIYRIGTKSGGGLFLSSMTILPEMTAFILFIRQGFISAGIGSILGSHIFNFGQIFIGDMIYNKDTVIHNQVADHLWSIGLMLSIMLTLFLIFICSGKKIKRTFSYFAFPVGIIFTYLIGWTLLTIYLG